MNGDPKPKMNHDGKMSASNISGISGPILDNSPNAISNKTAKTDDSGRVINHYLKKVSGQTINSQMGGMSNYYYPAI